MDNSKAGLFNASLLRTARLGAMAMAAGMLLWAGEAPAQETDNRSGGAASSQAEASETNPNPNDRRAAGEDRQLETDRSAALERGPLVAVGHDVELREDETADVVVVVFGSAKVHGKVRGGVVVVGGDLEVDGEVESAVVVVLGNATVGRGALLRQDVVTVMGTLNVEPKAKIKGDALAIAGRLAVARAASVLGQKREVAINLEWLRSWLLECLFKARPLAPQVGWVWIVAGAFFLLYLLVATAFPRPIDACVEVLNDRPATTIVLGILAKLLVPIVSVILALTGIGLLVLPFVILLALIGATVGKVALLEWIGLRVGHRTGVRAFQSPLGGFVLGAIILTLFYTVWLVGLLAYIWFSIWGLGIAVAAVLESVHQRRWQARTAPLPTAPAAPTMSAAAHGTSTHSGGGTEPTTAGFAGVTGPGGGTVAEAAAAPPVDLGQSYQACDTAEPRARKTATPREDLGHAWGAEGRAAEPAAAPEPPISAQPARPTVVPEALSSPRAGFWERMAAAFLDLVLLTCIGGLVDMRMPLTPLIALAYFVGLWTWKGTTVGGSVLRLRIVRLDGQPMTWMAGLVRALATVFSIVVIFLGLLWIAWDPEKQGWHDRIAGTVVVRLPRATPLV